MFSKFETKKKGNIKTLIKKEKMNNKNMGQ